MRVFLAVHPGEPLVAALSARLDGWTSRLPVRWTRPEGWHLTLQFLGEWPAPPLGALQEALAAAADAAPGRLLPAGLGAFPDLRRPRVLFLQLEDDGRVAALAARVRGIVGDVWPDGPQDTRPFRPHLTLARVKIPLQEEHINMLSKIDLDGLPEWEVPGFGLVASELLPDGPRYRELGFWRMRKKGE